MEDELARIMGSQELRTASSKAEKARILIDIHKFEPKIVLPFLQVSRDQLKRVRRAHRDGRTPGRVGNPRLLSDLEEDLLEKKILEASEIAQPMSIQSVLQVVSMINWV